MGDVQIWAESVTEPQCTYFLVDVLRKKVMTLR